MSKISANQKNLDFFENRLPDLLKDESFKGKFVVIHETTIKGTYDNFEESLSFALAHYTPNEFLIQQVVDESEYINFL